jgi:uncharacterized protein YjiS (DUF1127 family)
MTMPSLVRLALRALWRLLRAVDLRGASRELHTMPDHLLKDIGVARSSIAYVIAHGRFQEPAATVIDEPASPPVPDLRASPMFGRSPSRCR